MDVESLPRFKNYPKKATRDSKDPEYTINKRDSYINAVYRNIYMMARTGGTVGGGLVWQLMADGMSSYGDGYEILLTENPSTTSIISQQSHAMSTLSHLLRTESQNVPLGHNHRLQLDHIKGHRSPTTNHHGHHHRRHAHNQKRMRKAVP